MKVILPALPVLKDWEKRSLIIMMDKSPTHPSEQAPGDTVPSQFSSPYPSMPESLANGLQHCGATTAQKSEGFHEPPCLAPYPKCFH